MCKNMQDLYDQLNSLWKRAEEELIQFRTVANDIYTDPECDHRHLGFIKTGMGWKICTLRRGCKEWTPILSASMQERIDLVGMYVHLKELVRRTSKTTEGQVKTAVETMKRAMSEK